jgi:hypothetical protein
MHEVRQKITTWEKRMLCVRDIPRNHRLADDACICPMMQADRVLIVHMSIRDCRGENEVWTIS